jgi:hypothetical protein
MTDWNELISDVVAGHWKDPATAKTATVPFEVIRIEDDLDGGEADMLAPLKLGKRIAVVSDVNTHEAMGRRVAKHLKGLGTIDELVLPGNTHCDEPTIAMVQGACVAGGLMLAWVCDLIIASDDAFFQDPVVRMGIPGVEYFAHAHELNPRIAKEFLFLGERMKADRAYMMGMVNRVVPRDELEAQTYDIAVRIAKQPRMGLALTKTVINRVEELQGLRTTMDVAFGYHHFAHAHSQVLGAGQLGGHDAKTMAQANKKDAKE